MPHNNNVFSLKNSPVTISEILEATKLLQDKKTPDHNGISSNFLKKIIFNIAKPLHHILQQSFEKGIVPSQLKIAKVIPIFKNGDRCNMDNYRPISLLSCFSKIIEKIVAIRLTSFLTENNILSEWQFGFRSQHSTVHPMVHFTNFLSNAFNQKNTHWQFSVISKKLLTVVTTPYCYLNLKNMGFVALNYYGLNLTFQIVNNLYL